MTTLISSPAHQASSQVETVALDNLRVSDFDLSALHEINRARYPFLLESVAKGELGRFDILMAFPQHTIQLNNPAEATDFIKEVEQQFAESINPQHQCEYDLPFIGGWYAYFSYDYAQVVEPVLDVPQSKFPLAYLSRIPAAVIIDHENDKLLLVAETDFAQLLPKMQADIEALLHSQDNNQLSPQHIEVSAEQEEPESKYLQGVEAIKDYILSGDIFQVNLSRLWQVELAQNTDYLQVYRALRDSNPAPFAALCCMSDAQGKPWQVISSSPERLVKYQDGWVETRPIAGTRKRGDDLAKDKALIEELIQHPKERAEHIMLIDLERNDLGRISEPGTVEVNELMVIETYQHVHHIVSNVRGRLREGFSPLDIVHALFPGGTITGCPKIRCMQIIAELEQMPREAYTGSLGYINIDGSMDLNILIRTMMQFEQDNKPIVQFRAGAGIVADSKAQFELVESRHKAKGLVMALQKG